MLHLLLFITQVFSAPLYVVVDAGHGGKDSGAVRGKIREADLTLAVGKKLKRRLAKDPRFEVIETRFRDHFISLNGRAKIAKTSKADLFISLHVNSAPDRRAKGAEFYLLNQLPADEEMMYRASMENQKNTDPDKANLLIPHNNPEVAGILQDIYKSYRISHSWYLADSMRKSWTTNRTRKKSVRQAPFYLLENVPSPSVLVELGFMSNPTDMKRLLSNRHQSIMARDLHRAMIEYKELIDKHRIQAVDSVNAKK